MNRATRLAGLDESVSAYTLRHTAATWLVSKPNISIWQAFLGTSADMIERHYGHHAPDYLREAAAAIGRK
jgi:integrase